MKRILSVLLVIVMICALAVPVFAGSVPSDLVNRTPIDLENPTPGVIIYDSQDSTIYRSSALSKGDIVIIAVIAVIVIAAVVVLVKKRKK